MKPSIMAAGSVANLFRVQTDRFKTGLFSLLAAMPIDSKNACAAPLLLSVLRRGTVTYPTLSDISRRLDLLWGTGFSIRSSYRGNLLVVGFTANLLDGAYLPNGNEDLIGDVLNIMQEILLSPVREENGLLCGKYTESEKALQCDAIRAQKNNPRAYACDRLREILYESEPCGLPLYGTEKQTDQITAAALTDFYTEFLRSFHPIAVSIGSADADRLSRELSARFEGRLTAPEALPLCGHRLEKRRTPVRKKETLPVSQSQLVLGLRSGILLTDPDFFACSIYNELLGVSPISRLFVHVREKKSLCYACSSSYNGTLGALVISCGLKKENLAAAEEEILLQLHLLAEGDFTDAELNAAKRSLANAYRQLEDSAGGIESYWLGRTLMGADTAQTIDASIEQISRVRKEDVLRVANRISVEVTYILEGTRQGEEADCDEDEGI